MVPVWFFAILIFIICYLFYITRPSEETLVMMSKERVKRLQFWIRRIR